MALVTAAVMTMLGLSAGVAQAASAAVAAGPVSAWGHNDLGITEVPASLDAPGATAIDVGVYHGLGLTPAGTVVAWGHNSSGQTVVPSSLADKTVAAVSAGGYHSLALTSDGQVTGWGYNAYGQTDVPASLGGKTVTAITTGGYHSLALTSDGAVTAWGDNEDGQTDVPSSLAGKTVTAISAGELYSLALTSDGAVTAWGSNEYGQTDVPTSLAGVTAISAGGYHSLALTSDGQVTAWGNNYYGQTDVPASLAEKTVTAISGGYYHNLALTSDGQVSAWGLNDYGETDVPASLAGRAVTAISAGYLLNATISQSASTVDSPPSANDLAVTAGYESATPVTLSGTDPEDGTLTYAVVSQPAHGTLSGTAPALTYTPSDGYSGQDSFTYQVNDGTSTSAVATVTLTVSAQSCVPVAPTREFHVNADQRATKGTISSPKFTTKKTGELLVAFVAVNGPKTRAQSVTKLTGGGLTWKRVQRDNTLRGTSEIWQAYATKKLRSTRVVATLATRDYTVTLTVVGFSGARSTVGSAGNRSGTKSAPQVSLTPQTSGSVIWAVGRVIGSRYDPKPGTGQKVVHDQTFKSPSTGYWTQRATAPGKAGAETMISAKATASIWGYSAVEIPGACG